MSTSFLISNKQRKLYVMTQNSPQEIIINSNIIELKKPISYYNPVLKYADGFKVSPVFDCHREMENHSEDDDYHSLMHNIQKPMLAASKVEALSFFANKLLLREWTTGLVPIQKIFGFSSTLTDESEIQRLFKIVSTKAKNLDDFLIKPTNGSESIGTLKVYRYQNGLKTKFLGKKYGLGGGGDINSDKVISDYKTFKRWVHEDVLGVTSGDIDTHLRHIEPGLIIQDMFPHDKNQKGPLEMKYITAWGELLFVACRNGNGVFLGCEGEYLEGAMETAEILRQKFFHTLKTTALSLSRSSTFPNLRFDFFVDINSEEWVLNEIETIADCRSYPKSLLENTGKFYLNGWLDKAYIKFDSPLTVSVLRERLKNEIKISELN